MAQTPVSGMSSSTVVQLPNKLMVPSKAQILQSMQSSQFKSFATFPMGKSLKGMGMGGGGFMQAPKLPFDQEKTYDIIVIGGGTGGITCAQEARKHGLSVALFDYVEPSPHGSTWGLGGTCVNVGCIPKKLFHIGVQVHETGRLLEDYGWGKQEQNQPHDWNLLRDNIQNSIKSTNFGYVSKLSELNIDYINAKANFKDQNTIEFEYGSMMSSKQTYELKANNFVVATGGRPRQYPGIPVEYTITSDDLFSLKEDPGTTLVLGGGYIALECAGFLNGLGKEVYLANRSTFLRVMDQDMAYYVVDKMEEEGVKTMTQATVKNVNKLGDRDYEVEMQVGDKVKKINVNTILVAIGRDGKAESFGADKIGINVNRGKIQQGTDKEIERTNLDHIYAVGDIVEGVPELMPVAQQSGKLLAKRIAMRAQQQSSEQEILENHSTDYSLIPTTVFTPIEYSFVGLSEEEAIKMLGEDNIEVYHRETTPLQYSIYKKNTNVAYLKLIVDKSNDEKVIGMHYVGPSADEIIGGFGLAMRLGLKKSDLDDYIGVHPSISEDFFNLTITKRSGDEFRKTDC